MTVPVLPSTTVTSLTVTDGGPSSSVIVPCAAAVPITAFVAPLSVSEMVSFDSSIASPLTDTATACVVVPGANVSVPLACP